ncbi:MAG TPA: fibronectin type III domain-containing protein [Jatrophihabitans sp.]|uniref:fibronectin type III domain-containing protein n=1 Tax=Jatrophihabitans sp. TaxID=1932789 RepID=UPI002E093C9D|nr:fibronectin type III domain-containing protein [Jatrophihabitans sp.]
MGAPSVPSAPTGVHTIAVTTSSVDVAVAANPAQDMVNNYTVHLRDAATSGTLPGCTIDPTVAMDCTVTGLTAGTPINITVTASNMFGTSGSSVSVPTMTAIPPPSPPVFDAITTTPTSATAHLTQAPAVNGLHVWITVTATPSGRSCVPNNAYPIACTIPGLSPDHTYTFTAVATIVPNGQRMDSTPTLSDPVTLPGTLPNTPSVGTVTTTATTATVAVVPNLNPIAVSDPDSYTVTATPGGATCTTTAATSFGPCTITGLTPGATYTFTVTATNTQGASDPSTVSAPVTLPVTAPATPTVGAVTTTPESATVAVIPNPDPTATGPDTYTVSADHNGGTCSTDAASSFAPCVITGLTPGATYTFTVTARNAQGDSTPSAASAPVTLPGLPVTAPLPPTITKVVPGDRQLTVTITPAPTGDPATSYTVTATPSGRTCTIPAAQLVHGVGTCTITGLTDTTRYTLTGTAANATGTSPGATNPTDPVTPKPTSTPTPKPKPVTFPTHVGPMTTLTVPVSTRVASLTPTVCLVTGRTVVFLNPGRCTLTINSNHTTIRRTITVTKTTGHGHGTPLHQAHVYFGPDSANLTRRDYTRLHALLRALRRSGLVTVFGKAAKAPHHPATPFAIQLGQARANAVATYLRRHGVHVRLVVSDGSALPVAGSMAANRRADIAWF